MLLLLFNFVLLFKVDIIYLSSFKQMFLNSSRIPGCVISTAVNIAVQSSVVKCEAQINIKYLLCKAVMGQRRKEQGGEKFHKDKK